MNEQANNPTPDNTPPHPMRSTDQRMRKNTIFRMICLGATVLAVMILVVLLASILTQGVGGLNLDFLKNGNSSKPEDAGVSVSLIGTLMIVAICALSAIPLGVGTAVLIEEFKPKGEGVKTHITVAAIAGMLVIFGVGIYFGLSFGSLVLCIILSSAWFFTMICVVGKGSLLVALHGIVDTNIRNLAGVPSIVYGILGASAFAMMFGLFGDMGESRFAIGQDWYDQYQTEDKQVVYTPRAASANYDTEVVPAAKELTFYKTKDLDEQATDLKWMTEEDVEPVREAILSELDAFEDALRDAVKAERTSRRGPPEITADEAEQIADKAIEAGTWQSDPKALRPKLVKAIAGLNGLGFRELITAQNRAVALGVDAEYSTRVPYTMMIGKAPVRVDRKAWYHIALPFGRGVLAGGLTLMLVILPIIIVASQEALRAVPGSFKQGALSLGATKWQAIAKTSLPAAIPGICTGTILAISRAIGEAAPILVLGGTGYVTSSPGNLMDRFAALPMTIYYWSGLPDVRFQEVAAAGIIVLLIALLSFNALAIYIRHRSAKHH